jgi:shikimate dehydrogenase
MTLTNLDGATRLHVIVGDPIAQVKSPAGISAGLAARGANAILVPAHVLPGDLSAAIEGLCKLRNLDGIVVTIPHKFAMRAMCSRLSKRAEVLGAVNVIRREADGGWYGDMTDGLGFVAAMRKAGADPSGKRALLIGAGGAGSAMGLALIEAGVRELAVHDVDSGRRDALIKTLARTGPTPAVAGSTDPAGFDIVANATPAGMKPGDPLPIDIGRLDRKTYVGCVVTVPVVPPLIAQARALGCRTATGSDMFAAQLELIVDFLLGRDGAGGRA